MSNFEHHLEGNVKSLKTEEIVLLLGDQDKRVETKSTSNVLFNDSGNEIERVSFEDGDVLTFKQISNYDDSDQIKSRQAQYIKGELNVEELFSDGLLTEITESKPDGSIRSKSVYIYDLQQRLIYNARFAPNSSLQERTEIKYDRFGGRIVENILPDYLADGGLSENVFTTNKTKIELFAERARSFKVEYAADNNPVSAAFYYTNNSVIKEYKFSYKSNGLLHKVREYVNPVHAEFQNVRLPGFVKNILFTAKATYEYARQGDLQESVESLLKIPLIGTTSYQWNVFERLISKHRYMFGEIIGRTDFTYGSRGELLREAIYNEDNSIFQENNFQWEFDERGNWVKQVKTESPVKIFEKMRGSTTTITRIIEYFD